MSCSVLLLLVICAAGWLVALLCFTPVPLLWIPRGTQSGWVFLQCLLPASLSGREICAPNPLPSSKVAIEPFSLKLFTLSEEDKYTLITTALIARSHSLTHWKLQQFSPTTSSRTFGTRLALSVADIQYVLVTAEICQKRKCCKNVDGL